MLKLFQAINKGIYSTHNKNEIKGSPKIRMKAKGSS